MRWVRGYFRGVEEVINAGMMSSNTDQWETPQDLFDKLNDEFDFTTDVCALPENAKCSYFFTPKEDGLKMAWAGRCWMNPPYGREIGKWVQRAYKEVQRGVPIVVCLLPARTDTKWWHEYVMNSAEIRLIKGRLKFGGSKNSAPFPSAIVIFKQTSEPLQVKAVTA